MIYTGSFFAGENWGPGRLVNIAMDIPDGYFWNHYGREVVTNDLLKPEWWLVNGFKAKNIDVTQYRRDYLIILAGRFGDDWGALYRGLMTPDTALQVTGLEDGDTLVCWEPYGKFCHRNIVADILKGNGVEVKRR